MAVRDVQLFDDSVQSRTIAADVVVAADIDETVAYNFSSANSTFAGRATGLIDGSRYTAGTAVTMALNISSASGTFAGVATGVVDPSILQAGTAEITGGGSTNVDFPTAFATAPFVVATMFGTGASTTCSISAVSTANFTVYATAVDGGTVWWMAHLA